MKYLYILFPLVGIIIGACQSGQQNNVPKALTQHVDPFIGTAGHGHTYPGAALPFGMVQLSPDNGTEGWDWCSGYNYADSTIAGFSHLHLSGTGVGDLYDILYMPVTGTMEFPSSYKRTSELQYLPGSRTSEPMPYWSSFSHKKEEAAPGYYRVWLDDYGIQAELTATRRTGLQRYTFPESQEAAVVLDLGHSLNWDYPGETYVEVVDKQTVRGYRESSGWAEKQKVWFITRFSKPFSRAEVIENGEVLEQNLHAGEKLKALFHYNTQRDEQVILKTGISQVSMENAAKNLQKEMPGWDFDKIKDSAQSVWNKELQKISIKTNDPGKARIFYTALYHSMLAPAVFTDVNGQYTGADREVHQAEGYSQYTIFSLWDTFRASHPLFNLMQPERVNDFIKSMLAHYDETGALPMWPLVGNETHGMIGYHAVSVIAEAWFKGYRNYDVEKAFQAMKVTAMRDTFGLKHYKKLGYIPAEKENYSVSKTLEYAYDDWCIGQMAQALGKQQDADYFLKRAENWKHIYDTSTGFMRGKGINGKWISPFDPLHSNHFSNPYIEGNAWQYSWFVPHQVSGLIAAMGGKQAFEQKLDSLFAIKQQVKGEEKSLDISGLIGQYAHGNEPSHHVAYLYNYAGVPWKTQRMVDSIMKTMYADNPLGLSGNEDCGQMSSWYAFSSLGFYPVNPVSGIYVFGVPDIEYAELDLPGSKKLTIKTRNFGNGNTYIQRVERNGKTWNKSWIGHNELMKGGSLVFYMGKEPNKQWGNAENAIPPDGIVF